MQNGQNKQNMQNMQISKICRICRFCKICTIFKDAKYAKHAKYFADWFIAWVLLPLAMLLTKYLSRSSTQLPNWKSSWLTFISHLAKDSFLNVFTVSFHFTISDILFLFSRYRALHWGWGGSARVGGGRCCIKEKAAQIQLVFRNYCFCLVKISFRYVKVAEDLKHLCFFL